MNPIYGLAAASNKIWWGVLIGWGGSIPILGFFYAAYKYRQCKGRYWFFLGQGFVFFLFFALLGASLLFPSVFSSDTMQWVRTFTSFALPTSCIFGLLLLRRFEAKNPEEAERCRRVDEEMFR